MIRTTLGNSALDPGNDYKLTAWLGTQEDQHKERRGSCNTSLYFYIGRHIFVSDAAFNNNPIILNIILFQFNMGEGYNHVGWGTQIEVLPNSPGCAIPLVEESVILTKKKKTTEMGNIGPAV